MTSSGGLKTDITDTMSYPEPTMINIDDYIGTYRTLTSLRQYLTRIKYQLENSETGHSSMDSIDNIEKIVIDEIQTLRKILATGEEEKKKKIKKERKTKP